MRDRSPGAHHCVVHTRRVFRVTATTRQRTGALGEELARRHLENAGLTFVAANVRYRCGELDLVMCDVHGAIYFVEVRRRTRVTHGGAAASVTPAKCRRLIAAASRFLAAWRLDTRPCRFDVVAIEGGDESPRIVWIGDAFRPGG